MADLSPQSLQQQLLARVESLRAAGVEWLARGAQGPGAAADSQRTATPRAEAVLVAEASVQAAGEAPLPAPLEERKAALKLLADEVAGCMKCSELCSSRTQTVFGDGEPGVELCLIGEAPGADEDRQGLPFVGAAGQLLTKILQACGLRREDVYICNTLKCRPPGNRTPTAGEAGNCRDYLERQLALVRPKFICALGGTAATHLLQTTQSLGKLRGRFHDYKGIPVLVTYHPAFLLPHRHPERKRDVWEDMKLLMQRMGRPIPETKREARPSGPEA